MNKLRTHKSNYYLIAVLGLIFFGIATFCYLSVMGFINQTHDMCGNEIFREVSSPDKQYKVIIFSTNCGATTGYTTNVSIKLESATISNDEKGNIFTMDEHPKINQISANWVDNRSLSISFHSGFEVIAKKPLITILSSVFTIQYFKIQ